MKLPVMYDSLNPKEKREVRDYYIEVQRGYCFWCGGSLHLKAPPDILEYDINWDLFPPNFRKYPIHLQHDHDTGLTEGAVHAYCNAVMWQHFGR